MYYLTKLTLAIGVRLHGVHFCKTLLVSISSRKCTQVVMYGTCHMGSFCDTFASF